MLVGNFKLFVDFKLQEIVLKRIYSNKYLFIYNFTGKEYIRIVDFLQVLEILQELLGSCIIKEGVY